MNDAVVYVGLRIAYVGGAVDWDENCCIDGCCWDADEGVDWNVVTTVGRDAEAVAGGVEISDDDAVEGLRIFECVVENAAGGWRIFENSDKNAVGNAAKSAVTDADRNVGSLRISERVDGDE